MGLIISFLIYWMIFFVVGYIVTDYAQKYLYDETTPSLGLKLTLGTLILAILATKFRPSFDTMFTSEIAWTALQAIAWAGVFVLVFRFHPTHGTALGLATMILASGLATLAIDSLRGQAPEAARTEINRAQTPLRRPAYPTAPAVGDPKASKDAPATKAAPAP
jgi:hypothetical protein